MNTANSSFIYSEGKFNYVKVKYVVQHPLYLCLFMPICHHLLFCILPHSSSETHTFFFFKDVGNIDRIFLVKMSASKWCVDIQTIANRVNFLLVVRCNSVFLACEYGEKAVF